jgi:hypothetical protein
VAILSARPGGLSLVWLLAAAVTAGGAPAVIPSEREVEAAFLCSFAEFVEWPDARPDASVTVLVLGEDPFGPLLDETVKSRPLQTKGIEVSRSRRAEDAPRFQVVYVSASEKPRLAAILGALVGRSVLTVSDIPGFAEQGGVVGFVVEDKRVRFEINTAAADRARLRISSRLLTLARVVNEPSRKDG